MLAALVAGWAAPCPASELVPRFPRTGTSSDTAAYTHIVGVSPLHLLFGSVAGDYEQAVRPAFSLGVGATYSGPGSLLSNVPAGGYDVDVSGKARYYLAESAPVGPSIGLVGGFIYYRRTRRDEAPSTLPYDRTQFVPTLGFTADYNRTIGSAHRVVLGTGFGAKRRFAHVDNDYERFTLVQFTVRFLLGIAF